MSDGTTGLRAYTQDDHVRIAAFNLVSAYRSLDTHNCTELPDSVRLVELGERNSPPFCKSVKADKQYHDIYHLEVLTKSDFQTRSDEELKALIEAQW